MKIIPRAKQVLVEPVGEDPRESEHGIITPDNVEKEAKAVGTVLSVGKGVDDLKKGDKVIYGAFAGERIYLTETGKDIDYILLFDEDILATIKE